MGSKLSDSGTRKSKSVSSRRRKKRRTEVESDSSSSSSSSSSESENENENENGQEKPSDQPRADEQVELYDVKMEDADSKENKALKDASTLDILNSLGFVTDKNIDFEAKLETNEKLNTYREELLDKYLNLQLRQYGNEINQLQESDDFHTQKSLVLIAKLLKEHGELFNDEALKGILGE
ncbi:hypothetical protein PP7435_CHR4-0427 [Komagataella phaffii CBS 7435]|uniref:Ribosome-assembly protein 3 C-terminal domain-containing protein n=2 Tax=Komagataella phaffii TaxID=460519 RepID=C4R882_KOMPG|nr:Hypothetical protein PAS_chr4_0547 [Komagataella phaffii GS115]AOA64988.1 GQ67_04917T0 [Komagataella phaffii]CAH2450800.1 hypothetical protein BQ9382_C4-2215 [Komagataella phaffii CBS 7435]AOA70377.1 GQ68_04889T0 [Komagataella phaffii GS115]CAY71807.1 Hypothetical protein PAS_chr4_0547 [Komagataella phaffii GS115]CCA40594.1 hypothetical protein PP7435_CHR4-0427 [Komagataella phaffii CBS 7435]